MESREELLEIYRQNWEYIRHIESERLKFVTIYITIISALLVFIAAAVEKDLVEMYVLKTALGCMSAAGVFLLIFFYMQKNGYDGYRRDNQQIARLWLKNSPLATETEMLKLVPGERRFIKPFSAFFAAMILFILLPLLLVVTL